MSAAHRKISRLPVEIFEDLVTRPGAVGSEGSSTPEALRTAICAKLKHFPVKSRNGTAAFSSVKSARSLLETPRIVLLKALDPLLTLEEITVFLERACRHIAPKSTTAWLLLQKTTDIDTITMSSPVNLCLENCKQIRYLPTNLPGLDHALKGGIRIGTVTEVVGRAGCGKTQLALQLCTVAARYGQGAVYVDTERKVSLPRLQQISSLRAQFPDQADDQETYFSSLSMEEQQNLQGTRSIQQRQSKLFPYQPPEEVLNNVTVHTPTSMKDLQSTLDRLEEEILHRNQLAAQKKSFPVRLLIVDSIAAPARRDFGADAAPQRAAAVFQCAQTLKRLADQLHLGVLVINQVGLVGRDSSNHRARGGATDLRAALGNSWHHCVSTRLLMEHETDPHRLSSYMAQSNQPSNENDHHDTMYGQISTGQGNLRRLTIVKSNLVGQSSTNFEVTNFGLKEVVIPDNQ